MRSMAGGSSETCPFEFNFDPGAFKPGDLVSYRVSGKLSDFAFVGMLVEVHADHVMLVHADGTPEPQGPMLRGTRESRPVVSEEAALA